MQVTITIKGQCIIYFQDGLWNVVFITDTDECHKADFTHAPKKQGDPPDGLLRRDTVSQIITFKAVNATAAQPAKPGDLKNLLNLSASYLHGTNGNSRSRLAVHGKPGTGHQSIHMKVPYGSLTVDKITNSHDYFIERFGTGLPQTLGRPLASSVTITFDVSDGSKLMMNVQGGANTTTREYEVSEPLTLSFDNDCANPSTTRNDFLNIYQWVKDEYEESIQYVAGKLNVVKEESKEKLRILGPTGDCDPVVIDPPPGP